MWSKGAVVVIKRGDPAMADAIENGVGVSTKIPEEYKTMERDYAVMKVGRESEIQEKIRKLNNKYNRKPNLFQRVMTILLKPFVVLEVIYAMIICAIQFLFDPLLEPEHSRKEQRL